MPAPPQPRSFSNSLRNLRLAVLIFGGLNATLYAGLTPLWEGFDEPCHYAYVQLLWKTWSLPIPKHTCLPEPVVWYGCSCRAFEGALAYFAVQNDATDR